MNKKIILTAVGIISSFAIAIGGWVLTRSLIEIKSDKLLSGTFSIEIDTLDNMPVGVTSTILNGVSGNFASTRSSLTEDEIISILRNWSSAGRETPHEPTGEQLNMEQAIEVGREWFSFIGGFNIFPDDLLHWGNARAYLFQNLPQGQGGRFLPPAYSYWRVGFINDSMSVNIVINAVTGQVWKTEINVIRFDIDINEHNIINALTALVSTLEINSDEDGESEINAVVMVTNQNGNPNEFIDIINDNLIISNMITVESESLTASHSFADGNAYAEVIAIGWRLEDDRWIIGNFTMRLTDKNQ